MPSPRPTRSPFARTATPNLRIVRNAADDSAEMSIYDEIGPWYGVNAKAFIADLKSLDVSTIHVRINSPGGSVFDAVAIANALREHDAHVVAHIDALAASAASFLAMAANEVRMADNAFLMIHDAWTIAAGNAEDLRKVAGTLDKIGGAIVGEYMKKTGAEQSQVETWMHDETWFNAEEALQHGFVDAIDGAASVSNSFDLSVFAHAPAALGGRRSTDRTDPKRDIERTLRDAGYSRSEAKAIAALAPSVLSPRDVATDEAHDLTGSLQDLLQAFASPA